MPVSYKLCHKLNCSSAKGDGRNCYPGNCTTFLDKVVEMVSSGQYSYNSATHQVTCNVCGGEAGEHAGIVASLLNWRLPCRER